MAHAHTHAHTSQIWPSMPHFQPFHFSMEPLLAINKVTMQMYSDLAKENLNVLNECMECNLEMMNEMKNAKGMEAIMAAQTAWASKFSPCFYKYTQHMLEIISKSASEYNKCFNKGLQQFEHEKHERKTKQ